MKIGDVVKILSKDYPSVSISRIRFLEKEGLIKINRSKGGTRELTELNISTLRSILNLQENHYVTLKAIKNNPSILKNNNPISLKDKFSLNEALKHSGLSKKKYNALISMELEIVKKEYSNDDIFRFKSWGYLFAKGLRENNLSAIKGISDRGASYLEQLIKVNSLPKNQANELSKHLGNIIGGTIFFHMEQ